MSRMIVSYRGKRTKDFVSEKRVKAFFGVERSAENKLAQLDSATALADLRRPGNRLEALKGSRKGQYSIRINDQWRVCFEWPAGSPGPVNVEIVDYH
jgi:proteic killer suppression protein